MYDKAIELNPKSSEACINKGIKLFIFRCIFLSIKKRWGGYLDVWLSHKIGPKFYFSHQK